MVGGGCGGLDCRHHGCDSMKQIGTLDRKERRTSSSLVVTVVIK